jgi:hypothetical protein
MIVGLCMARNEEALIGLVIDHLYANGVDRIIIEDGHSTDATYAVAVEHGATVLRETDRAYDQPARMSRLAAEWCSPGDWVIPFDADEFWYSDQGTIRQALTDCEAAKCWARMFLHRDWDHRARSPKPLPKVAFRYQPGAEIAFGNHSVTVPGPDVWGVLDIREWQYQSFGHLCEKAAKQRDLLAATPDLDRRFGAHKNMLAAMSDSELEAEWVRMQEGDWLFDPIPSLLSPPFTQRNSSKGV